ncbi:hypothetical protein [Stenotrophomonas maltophilia]|uniref:hypothetical protein n=1 Tax=Stenotrophomonas maltophilia TaxID=40324 RepID=UPI00021E0B19|nr:hypothetical protein [Stenotrophomonas maltophilia]AEM51481.1 hypothetical protein BurJV3_2158 [Stenotrophomonas maltophilia JV3]
MKTTHRKTLLAALLACLAPAAASAAEGYLTPSKNGGSGTMPSGYTKLYFELASDDFVDELVLPANARLGDRVVLSTLAWGSSRLDAKGTAVEDLVYIPVESLSNFELIRMGERWGAVRGLSSDRIVLEKSGSTVPPITDKLMTDIHVFGDFRSVQLPASAPGGAVAGVQSFNGMDVTVTGVAGGASICQRSSTCGFVFDAASSQWHARRGRAHFQPTTSQLPMPQQRWTDIVTGSAAEDVTTPPLMMFPTSGIDGDIMQFTDPSNSNFFRVMHPNGTGATLTATPRTYRYSSQQGRWIHQPR